MLTKLVNLSRYLIFTVDYNLTFFPLTDSPINWTLIVDVHRQVFF